MLAWAECVCILGQAGQLPTPCTPHPPTHPPTYPSPPPSNTQVRFHLPVWLGVGEALSEMIADGKLELLQEMYQKWMFFRVTLDMLEMVFAKADPRVVKM